ncbi:MAG: pyridoxal-phosphate dependent enzyme, partial [Gemmatimonadota bacterium]
MKRADLESAAELVHSVFPPTPQLCWPLLCERAGAEVWVKHENHTPVGSFKVRGGLVYMSDLRARRREIRGVVAATRGNHGQSIAFAARRLGLLAAIVVPEGNGAEKNAAMRALGAEVIVHGDDFQEAYEYVPEISNERGWVIIPSFHRELSRGIASYALELFG